MFNMKNRKNLKEMFEELRDFDFTVNRVHPRVVNGKRQTVLFPAGSFSLFGITVIEATAICKKISSTRDYICTAHLITD